MNESITIEGIYKYKKSFFKKVSMIAPSLPPLPSLSTRLKQKAKTLAVPRAMNTTAPFKFLQPSAYGKMHCSGTIFLTVIIVCS